MSDAILTALIIATGPTLVGLLNGWALLKNGRKIDRGAEVQAENGRTMKEVHTLVNSGSTEQLRIGMVSAKALAAITKDPEHVLLAEIAEKKYNDSVKKQEKP